MSFVETSGFIQVSETGRSIEEKGQLDAVRLRWSH
jgi:hypothetical protein